MSSFKRKGDRQATSPSYLGARTSLSSPQTYIVSTGIPSLDDLLGGGLPLTSIHLILASDVHSSYGELVQKYFMAQGFASKQYLCVVGYRCLELLRRCMWQSATNERTVVEDEGVTKDEIKIAWRYENMKQFRTTVDFPQQGPDDYCRTFDLTRQIPDDILEHAFQSGALSIIDLDSTSTYEEVLHKLDEVLTRSRHHTSIPLRICIPGLGSPHWGDLKNQDIIRFLYFLRNLLRRHPHACASISLSSHLGTDKQWIQKLAWVSDSAISLDAFSADPSLSALFPSHHGMVRIHRSPAPHTILAPSEKYSTLRGILAGSTTSAGGGENNLAFRCTRKSFIFETLHLDVGGGVGERRTTAPAAIVQEPVSRQVDALPKIVVQVDAAGENSEKGAIEGVLAETTPPESGKRIKSSKTRKKVAFESDKPDLYEF